jgi:hypothetical protein
MNTETLTPVEKPGSKGALVAALSAVGSVVAATTVVVEKSEPI